LLKADWDADEHPRWPAGTPDSQGGQFAPKGDDTGQTSGDAMTPRASRDAPPDATISPRQRFYGDDVPSNIQPALRDSSEGIEALLDGGRQPSANEAEDLGASYGNLVGDVQLASTTIALDGAIPLAQPANWANLTRLANGALRLGSGQIITAASLLSAWDMQRERAAVDDAFAKFGLDPTNAANVLAIRAYVWAHNTAPLIPFGPRHDISVPFSGPQLESVSQFIMALELARPGTLFFALHRDAPSKKYLDVAVELGMQGGAIFESRPGPRTCPRRSRPRAPQRAPLPISSPTTRCRPIISFPPMCGARS
jgi:hypothetical protein